MSSSRARNNLSVSVHGGNLHVEHSYRQSECFTFSTYISEAWTKTAGTLHGFELFAGQPNSGTSWQRPVRVCSICKKIQAIPGADDFGTSSCLLRVICLLSLNHTLFPVKKISCFKKHRQLLGGFTPDPWSGASPLDPTEGTGTAPRPPLQACAHHEVRSPLVIHFWAHPSKKSLNS